MQRFFISIKASQLKRVFTYVSICAALLISLTGNAQPKIIRQIGERAQGGLGGGGSSADSLQKRNKLEDSITISFRYLDSTRNYKLDSSVGDFTRRFPLPATYMYLGNLGTAAKSLLFSPMLTAGFDPGFHAFDIYKWKMETVRFFSTTRPYSEINYQLGTRVEQVIELLHTQNIRPNWNFMFQYRLINSPGFFKSQKTNHNNYLLTSKYNSPNLRYTNYVVLLGNKLHAAENGGIQDTANFIDDKIYKDRFNIPTKLGGDDPFSSNFFSTKINTGNKYSEFTALMRQQYDIGRKDSLVSDSTAIPLFFPRLRFEHTIQLDQNKYTFIDYAGDSMYYKTFYDTSLRRPRDSFMLGERWQILTNDLSIYQFPDANNQHQFIKLGVMFQNISGELSSDKQNFFNTAGHAEYRNKTRNQLWDIEANGKLFFTGYNAGDFHAHISLQRLLGNKLGYLQLGFENASRTPSFNFDTRSSFYLMHVASNFKKENNTHLFASYYLPSFRLKITGNYFLLTNYTYITNYKDLQQQSGLFNVLQIALQKTFKIGRRWNWHADVYFQQAIGDAPVNLPTIFTRHRIAYEGNLGFKNLDIAMGAEFRFRTDYNADGYSPVLGQFFYQDTEKVSYKMPDIAGYMHFRIRPFKAFIRAENLNTARNLGGFGFTNNNFTAPGYALPGLQFRVGIYWSFVN